MVGSEKYPGLGFDPAPGQPAVLAAAAGRLATVAGVLERSTAAVCGLDSSSWIGVAAQELRARQRELTADLGGAHQAQAAGARALADYAEELAGMQRRAAQLEAQAQELLARQRSAATRMEWLVGQRAPAGSAQLAGLQSDYDAAAALHEQAGQDLAAVREWARALQQAHGAAAARTARAFQQAMPAGQAGRGAATAGLDIALMRQRILACVTQKETSGNIRESEYPTVSGVKASMATPNQTTMINALTTLRNHPEIAAQAHPPLTKAEVEAADARTKATATLVGRAETVGTETGRAATAERAARAKQAAAQQKYDQLARREGELSKAATAKIHAAQGAAAGSALAKQAEQAKVALAKAHLATEAAKKPLADTTAAATAAAERARLAGEAAAGNADSFVKYNAALMSQSGLSADDLKTMYLAARLRRWTPANNQAIAQLEKGGSRITGEAMKTYRNGLIHGETVAGWQRLAVDKLDMGSGSVGKRINDLAIRNDPKAPADAFPLTAVRLNKAMDAVLKANGANERAIIEAVAKAQNAKEAGYAADIWNCYQAKKSAKRK